MEPVTEHKDEVTQDDMAFITDEVSNYVPGPLREEWMKSMERRRAFVAVEDFVRRYEAEVRNAKLAKLTV